MLWNGYANWHHCINCGIILDRNKNLRGHQLFFYSDRKAYFLTRIQSGIMTEISTLTLTLDLTKVLSRSRSRKKFTSSRKWAREWVLILRRLFCFWTISDSSNRTPITSFHLPSKTWSVSRFWFIHSLFWGPIINVCTHKLMFSFPFDTFVLRYVRQLGIYKWEYWT